MTGIYQVKGLDAMDSRIVTLNLPIVADNNLSLIDLARRAVGRTNLYNICPSIPFERLVQNRGVGGIMYPMLIPCLPKWGETAKKVAQRIAASGFILGDIAELAQLAAKYPDEIRKFAAVFALDHGSRWKNADGDICVSYVNIDGSRKRFSTYRLDRLFDEEDCVLVFRQVGHRFLALPPAVPCENNPCIKAPA